MKKIAILSQKGGAGKTTLGLNLGVAAELKKMSTAIIDLDPQASITQWGDSRGADTPIVVSAQAARLPKILKTCEENGADLVIIDTAPHAERSALEAARSADLVIIPCRPSIVDLRAIGSTVDICRIAETPAYIVLNQAPSRGSLAEEATQAIASMEVDVAPIIIGQRIAYVHAVTAGQGVQEYEPRGKAAEEMKKLFSFIMKRAGGQNGKIKEK
jgi:chromosome partitioning protein